MNKKELFVFCAQKVLHENQVHSTVGKLVQANACCKVAMTVPVEVVDTASPLCQLGCLLACGAADEALLALMASGLVLGGLAGG